MPSGRTHDIITAVATPVVAYGTYLITKDMKTAGKLTAIFVFASLMFNGDLDIESAPYHRWFILKFIWIPYQKMFWHRSIFTHGLIIGTIIRLLYIGTIPFLYYLFKGHVGVFFHLMTFHTLIFIYIGLELGSAIHTISDYVF